MTISKNIGRSQALLPLLEKVARGNLTENEARQYAALVNGSITEDEARQTVRKMAEPGWVSLEKR